MAKSHNRLAILLAQRADERGFKAELRRKTGFSSSQLERYLDGSVSPSLDVLDRIAAALNLQPWELLRPPDAVPSNPEKDRLDALQALLTVLPQLDHIALRGVLEAAQIALDLQQEASGQGSVKTQAKAK